MRWFDERCGSWQVPTALLQLLASLHAHVEGAGSPLRPGCVCVQQVNSAKLQMRQNTEERGTHEGSKWQVGVGTVWRGRAAGEDGGGTGGASMCERKATIEELDEAEVPWHDAKFSL